jgi:hypothetical protein
MAISELYLAHSLNKAGYIIILPPFFFYYEVFLLEIFKTAHGRVAQPRETDWEFCRPPLAGLPSSGLHFLRTRIRGHLGNSGRPGSKIKKKIK